jgi:tRNA A37 threonylcarbamoyladenosine dehydratase
MDQKYSRIAALFKEEDINTLNNSKVAIFGLGGVGGYVCEALARCGVSHLILIDKDVVEESNINRQIIALTSTIGLDKVDLFKKHILDINPNCEVIMYKRFIKGDDVKDIDLDGVNYICDAIDCISAKISLIKYAKELNIPIISAMGTGKRMDPTKLEITDISKTFNDPLAKVIRKRLKEEGVEKLDVVFSSELPIINKDTEDKETIGSMIFVPASAGLLMANYVVKKLISFK